MRVRFAILLGVALLVCSMGWSQNKSLGDVAGSIKLNPEAIVVKEGVVEDPRAETKADGELLKSVLTDCSAEADQLGGLVEQARATTVYRGDDVLTRLEASALELERQIHGISLLRLKDDLAEPFAAAWGAGEVCEAAAGSVRSELTSNGATFSRARTEVARCRDSLSKASEILAVSMSPPDLSAEQAAAGAEEPTGADATSSDEEIIAAKCEPIRSKGIDFYESCRNEQYLAQAAMASRNAANEMLDEGVFSDIRAVCSRLYHDTFVGRNICEQDRMTTARLEADE